MKLLLGCDHAAFSAKEDVLKILRGKAGVVVEDLGTFSEERCDYPVFAEKVSRLVAQAELKSPYQNEVRGLLLCGSGVGVSIVANRFQGVRAGLCRHPDEAALARGHNGINILCVGARISSLDEIAAMVEVFLKTPFDGGRHKDRLELFKSLGQKL